MRWLAVVPILLVACADPSATPGPDAGPGDGGGDAASCPRSLAPADGPRHVVVSMPYDAAGGQASTWARWTLGADGALTDTGTRFQMGRATGGEVAFTPDGAIGVAAQSDGSLGVFRIDGDAVTVVHAAFHGSFYAERVVMAADGAGAYVIDPNWATNGGGVYRVDIACDGTLTDRGRWFDTKLAAGLHLGGAGGATRAVMPAAQVGASPIGDDVHVLDWSTDPPTRLAGADAFGDDDAIVGGSAVTADGRFALVGDTSQFAGVPNRVAVVRLDGATATPVTVLSPVEDPYAIVASPFDDAALVVSGFGDALVRLGYAPTAATPFVVRGPLTYVGAPPQLPGDAVLIDRGAQRGLVLVAENVGIRRVRFAGGGAITDLGKTSTGTGTAAIVGALGVQP